MTNYKWSDIEIQTNHENLSMINVLSIHSAWYFPRKWWSLRFYSQQILSFDWRRRNHQIEILSLTWQNVWSEEFTNIGQNPCHFLQLFCLFLFLSRKHQNYGYRKFTKSLTLIFYWSLRWRSPKPRVDDLLRVNWKNQMTGPPALLYLLP